MKQIESVKMTANVECIILNEYTIANIVRARQQVIAIYNTISAVLSDERPYGNHALKCSHDMLKYILGFFDELVEAIDDPHKDEEE